MRFGSSIAFAAIVTVLFTGCSRTEAFDVSVRNDTADALTLAPLTWLFSRENATFHRGSKSPDQ